MNDSTAKYRGPRTERRKEKDPSTWDRSWEEYLLQQPLGKWTRGGSEDATGPGRRRGGPVRQVQAALSL